MSSFRNPSPGAGFWSIERVVAVLTPLFSAVAGWVTTIVAKAVPGIGIPQSDLAALFIAGATFAAAAALKWLHGRQKFVNFATDADQTVARIVAEIRANTTAGPALADIEGILRAHTAQIIDAVGHAMHASPSAEAVAQQLAQRLVGQPPAAPQTAAVQGAAPTA